MQAVSLCDPDKEALQKRAEKYRILETYARVDEMIAKADLDVAIVCTPTSIRKEVLFPLIDAKIPIFCEKPFAETFSEAKNVEEKARRAGAPMAINQNFRRHFTFDVARKVLDQNGFGRPLHLAQTAEYLRRDQGWRLERDRYVMSVMSIHWFDGYRYLLREEPRSVYCCGVNSPATPGGEDTAVSVILTFPSGTVVCLSESFSSFSRQNGCSLDCESGGLLMGYDTLTEVRQNGERIEHKNPFDKAEATYYLLDDLMKSVEEERQPETSAADNLNSMRILEGAYRSFKENRVVRLEEIQ
jgi:predicted dehydrogenase